MAPPPTHVPRSYDGVLAHARPIPDRDGAMQRAVALLWDAFGEADPSNPSRGRVSWVGFYAKSRDADEMVLICREPKPACSPIGLGGMCGRGWRERRAFVVRDVAVLGENYIACDPRDQSELVVPMFDARGICWGVLDVDSYQVGAFERDDAVAMNDLCARLGLTTLGASIGVTCL